MLLAGDSLVFRVVLVGDSSVGKTSIVNSFLHKSFNGSEPTTIGAAHESYAEVRDGLAMELQIWDTAGQEKYKSLGPVYYRQAAAALAVFDMANRDSFDNLPGWVREFRSVAGSDAVVVVVGNKTDLDPHAVSCADAEQWCAAQGFAFVPTSAKLGTAVPEVFDLLLTRLALTRRPATTKLAPPPAEPDGGGCC
jgi:small GTP-binding protein